MEQRQPKGTITIKIYEGGEKEATFTGEVEPNDVFSCRITLQTDYASHLNAKALAENKAAKEKKRIAAEQEALEKQKELKVQQEKELAEQKKAQEKKVAEAKKEEEKAKAKVENSVSKKV